MYPKRLLQWNWNNVEWLNRLDNIVNEVCGYTGFEVEKIEEKSRCGLVLYGKYNSTSAVLKILPPEKKESNEILYIRRSTSEFLNRALVSDIKYGYYIMPKGDSECKIDNVQIFELFNYIVSQPEASQDNFIYYEEKIDEKICMIEKENEDSIIKLMKKAKEIFEEYFVDEQHFLLHGDIRRDNMIYLNDKLLLIDPIGINAPIEFSLLRYFEDVLFCIEDYKLFCHELDKQLNYIANFGLEKERVKNALLIDSIFRTSSSYLMKEDKHIIQKGINDFRWIYDNR